MPVLVSQPSPSAASDFAVRPALAALLRASAVLGLVAVVVRAVGGFADEQLPFVGLGLALAAVAVGLAFAFARRVATASPRATVAPGVVSPGRAAVASALDAQRLQALLGAGLVVKLVVLAVAFGAMAAGGLKFPYLLAFALAFAGAALVLQLVMALHLARRLSPRAAATPASLR